MTTTTPKKTGGQNGPWVTWTRPKPPAVEDHYAFWGNKPAELSERCLWWMEQFEAGFRPSRRVLHEGYDSSAEWYGVWIWEYLNVICEWEGKPR